MCENNVHFGIIKSMEFLFQSSHEKMQVQKAQQFQQHFCLRVQQFDFTISLSIINRGRQVCMLACYTRPRGIQQSNKWKDFYKKLGPDFALVFFKWKLVTEVF